MMTAHFGEPCFQSDLRSLMRLSLLAIVTVMSVFASDAEAQSRLPSVAKIMEQHDGDQDGRLTSAEVAGSQYARQFSRWDGDQDGKVSREDIVRFRRRFGIAADGSRLARPPFEIPDVKDLPRVDREHRADIAGGQALRLHPANQAAPHCG